MSRDVFDHENHVNLFQPEGFSGNLLGLLYWSGQKPPLRYLMLPLWGVLFLPFQPAHCTARKLPPLCVLCLPRLDQESLQKHRELPSLPLFIKMSSWWLSSSRNLLQAGNHVLLILMSAVLGIWYMFRKCFK